MTLEVVIYDLLMLIFLLIMSTGESAPLLVG